MNFKALVFKNVSAQHNSVEQGGRSNVINEKKHGFEQMLLCYMDGGIIRNWLEKGSTKPPQSVPTFEAKLT